MTAKKTKFLKVIGNKIASIEHIDSTAVLGLAAKPVIDIMIAINNLKNAA